MAHKYGVDWGPEDVQHSAEKLGRTMTLEEAQEWLDKNWQTIMLDILPKCWDASVRDLLAKDA